MTAVQPRYAAYCAAHGMNPDEMLAYDRGRFPGGVMAGYMIWFAERAIEFTAGLPGRDWLDRLHRVDPAAFDAYLRSFTRGQLVLGLSA